MSRRIPILILYVKERRVSVTTVFDGELDRSGTFSPVLTSEALPGSVDVHSFLTEWGGPDREGGVGEFLPHTDEQGM